MSASDSWLAHKLSNQKGILIMAAAENIINKLDSNMPQSDVSKSIKNIGVLIREENDQLYITAEIKALSADKAENVDTLLKGFQAMAQLSGDANYTQVLSSMNIVRKKEDITIRIHIPVKMLPKLINIQGNILDSKHDGFIQFGLQGDIGSFDKDDNGDKDTCSPRSGVYVTQ